MKRRYPVMISVLVAGTAALAAFALVLRHDSPCGSAQTLPADTHTMKAMVSRCYGPPTVVRQEEIARPAPADDRVLVRVRAASVNPLDWHYLRGTPYVMRAMGAGVGSPKDIRMGVDFAGTVESVGRHVTRFKPGDEVFGGADGAFAEYVSVAEGGALVLKPANLTFEQAAAAPIAAVTALQALRDTGKIHAGQKILINGASGGVGTFAVQIAKWLGAEVTGVTSTHNLDMVRAIGADHVIDYTREDFTRGAQRYDVILDCVGNRSLTANSGVLVPHGIYVGIGGGGPDDQGLIGPLIGPLEEVLLTPFLGRHLLTLFADLAPGDLAILSDLMSRGTVVPVIDRTYPLAEVPAALAYLEKGHARGKVVITLQDQGSARDPRSARDPVSARAGT